MRPESALFQSGSLPQSNCPITCVLNHYPARPFQSRMKWKNKPKAQITPAATIALKVRTVPGISVMLTKPPLSIITGLSVKILEILTLVNLRNARQPCYRMTPNPYGRRTGTPSAGLVPAWLSCLLPWCCWTWLLALRPIRGGEC